MKKDTKKSLALGLSLAMALSTVSIAPTSVSADTVTNQGLTAKAATAPAVKTYSYHAYLSFQTDYNWLFRSNCYETSGGKNSTTFTYKDSADKEHKVAYDYSKNYAKAGAGFGKYEKSGGVYTANMTDVTIDHNGTYTVGISGIDLSPAGEGLSKNTTEDTLDNFRMLGVSTDITKKCPGVKFSDLSLNIDGKTINSGVPAFAKSDSMDAAKNNFYTLMMVNAYGTKDAGDLPAWVSSDRAFQLKNSVTAKDEDKTIASKYMPTKSMSITFTVSGVDFTKDPALYLNKTSVTKPSAKVIAKGKKFTKSGIKYKVTSVSKSGKYGKVAVVDVSKASKKSYKVPSTIKYNSSNKYKVTSVASNAFKNCKKATKITLGKYVTSISKSAFKSCKKLSKLSLSSKLTSVKKGAFSGCKKSIKVTGTKKYIKKNKAKLKKCGYKKFK